MNASDNFNRADETPLAAPWATCYGGGAHLVSNAVRSTTGTDRGSFYNSGTWTANQLSRVTVVTVNAATMYAGVLVRADSAGNAFQVVTDGRAGTGGTEFARWNSGVYTALGGINTTFASGDTLELEVSGTSPNITLICRKNGAQVGQLTGVTGPNSGNPGVGCYGLAVVDDWYAQDDAVTTALEQKAYRFFNDDGSESNSTPMAAQNTNVTVAANGVFRVRLGIQATGDPAAQNFRLEFKRTTESIWRGVV